MYRLFFTIFLQLLFVLSSIGQLDTIRLKNPSFEGSPQLGAQVLPNGWMDCGNQKFPEESPPDVHPFKAATGVADFKVVHKPNHGSTYLGMVVRDNETYESIAQQLRRSLKRDKCYQFKIFLARSKTYESYSKLSGEIANYTTPAILRIYGGYGYCQEKELLGETYVIIGHRWLEYSFRFEPQGNYDHITLQAFYRTPSLNPYNGHILLDNASNIFEIHCEEPQVEEEIAEADPVVKISPPVRRKQTPKQPEKVKAEPEVFPSKSKIIPELDKNNIKEGQTIRINKLYFKADSIKIEPESHEVLMELYDFLVANPNVKVEIGGHSNTIPPHVYCDKISTARAKSVSDYLIDKGVKPDRLIYKGYGKRKALTKSTTKWGRQRNQRVEIKILRI